MWQLDRSAVPPAWRDPAEPRVRLAFSTRLGGVSAPPFDTLNLGRSTDDRPEAVADNRVRFLAALGLDPSRLVTAGQVHGADVREALAPGHLDRCDALVTRQPGLTLAVTTADCMPLLMVAPGAVAAVHAGWRGTAAEAPRRALEALCRLAGVAPSEVGVHLGPCIRSCCYQVGPEVADRFVGAAVQRNGDVLRLDLPRAARDQLRGAGVAESAWHDTGGCTSCERDLYFSHRRDAGRTGRHWGVIAMSE